MVHGLPPREPADDSWDAAVHRESSTQRLGRNWADLLQELRVVQTGVQLLTGFLLSVPLQQRFAGLSAGAQTIDLATVSCSVLASVVLIAPVGVYRLLFRRHGRGELVTNAHRMTLAGGALLACTVVALIDVVLLIFDVVKDATVDIAAGSLTATTVLLLWVWLPLQLQKDATAERAEAEWAPA